MSEQETLIQKFPPEKYKDVSIPVQDILRTGVGLSLGLLFAPLFIFGLIHGFNRLFDYDYSVITLLLLLVPVLILAIIVHEALHAVGWMVVGRLPWNALTFGIDWRNLAPYAHAKVPMRASAYRFGGALPGIVTGLIPALLGILAADGLLTMFSAFMLSAAVGDILVLWVIRDVPGKELVLDHPSNAGCFVLLD